MGFDNIVYVQLNSSPADSTIANPISEIVLLITASIKSLVKNASVLTIFLK